MIGKIISGRKKRANLTIHISLHWLKSVVHACYTPTIKIYGMTSKIQNWLMVGRSTQLYRISVSRMPINVYWREGIFASQGHDLDMITSFDCTNRVSERFAHQ